MKQRKTDEMNFEVIESEFFTGKQLSKNKLSAEEVAEQYMGDNFPAELFALEPGKEVVFYHNRKEVTAIRLK